jgi:hypothetical protein
MIDPSILNENGEVVDNNSQIDILDLSCHETKKDDGLLTTSTISYPEYNERAKILQILKSKTPKTNKKHVIESVKYKPFKKSIMYKEWKEKQKATVIVNIYQ